MRWGRKKRRSGALDRRSGLADRRSVSAKALIWRSSELRLRPARSRSAIDGLRDPVAARTNRTEVRIGQLSCSTHPGKRRLNYANKPVIKKIIIINNKIKLILISEYGESAWKSAQVCKSIMFQLILQMKKKTIPWQESNLPYPLGHTVCTVSRAFANVTPPQLTHSSSKSIH